MERMKSDNAVFSASGGDVGEEERGETKEKKGLMVVILVGLPGSGKSTFCEQVMASSTRPWVRVCQDIIGNGKGGTKSQCLMSASSALKGGKNVFVDRCNLKREHRVDFIQLGTSQVDVHAVVLDLPTKMCISRCVKRTGHEGNLQGGKAALVVNKMIQNKELPKLSEGFSRIIFCHNEADVQDAVSTYVELGPEDTLPCGCFGQKNPDSNVQQGIMKFFKKVDPPVKREFEENSSNDEKSNNISSETVPTLAFPSIAVADSSKDKKSSNISSETVPTLAFPSISTADFQFDLEKASDIIVEKVVEFLPKLPNARLCLVDLSDESKILSLVRAKAGRRNISHDKFFTFVGDITRLYTGGHLRCNVIANAANWRLKPGGGGVNAAIFSAAGSALETATKDVAGSIRPGQALIVPLPSTSPLFIKEGVTHIIHVLGPNMNPRRPNFLNNDYVKGSKVLRETYSSLFEGFASILRSPQVGPLTSESRIDNDKSHAVQTPSADQKFKRKGAHQSEVNKRCKALQDNSVNVKKNEGASKTWGSWAQALYQIAMNPEDYRNDVKEFTDEVVVLNDTYPKARKHFLVLARDKGLDRLADVRIEHIPLLKTMHAVGLRWAEKCISEDKTLVFRLGYHSAPSMRQLHLHVISQDFNSHHLKNKKHWNSFNTPFFRDSGDVIEEVNDHGQATLKDDEKSFFSMELRCNRCRSAHPNIPRLKSHISNCPAPFPSSLLRNGCLVSS